MNERQKTLLDFDQGKEDLIIGSLDDLAYDLEDLLQEQTLNIIESHTGGLTGLIYRIEPDYNLKKKRLQSKVQNIDGDLSFLNELMCRRKLEHGRQDNPILAKGIVKTLYANYRKGILLSDWIHGQVPDTIDMSWIRQVISITLEMQKYGLFEWDLSQGNILIEEGQVKLFDFGYCYEFDPLSEYNSDGLSSKGFHPLERLETRFLMMLFLNLQEEMDATYLSLYKAMKKLGVELYKDYLYWLIKNKASQEVIDYYDEIIETWQRALLNDGEAKKRYVIESYRAHLFDVYDDISGQSCNPNTLRRLKALNQMLDEHYPLLVEAGLIEGDLSREDVKEQLKTLGEKAASFQI